MGGKEGGDEVWGGMDEGEGAGGGEEGKSKEKGRREEGGGEGGVGRGGRRRGEGVSDCRPPHGCVTLHFCSTTLKHSFEVKTKRMLVHRQNPRPPLPFSPQHYRGGRRGGTRAL